MVWPVIAARTADLTAVPVQNASQRPDRNTVMTNRAFRQPASPHGQPIQGGPSNSQRRDLRLRHGGKHSRHLKNPPTLPVP